MALLSLLLVFLLYFLLGASIVGGVVLAIVFYIRKHKTQNPVVPQNFNYEGKATETTNIEKDN